MKKVKFPQLIHVRQEELDGEDPFFVICPGGVFDSADSEPMAIYKLVSVGVSQVTHSFKAAGKRRD